VTENRVRRRRRSIVAFIETEGGLRRVRSLVALFDRLVSAGPEVPETPTSDILRAAVVLLHAQVEEFVRYVAGQALPFAGKQALDRIPLIGTGRWPKRFLLGALTRHRGKPVESLLAESVQEHLAKRSFGSVGDIVAILGHSGIPGKGKRLRIRRALLASLIRRRHQIVHEGDVRRRRVPSLDLSLRGLSRGRVLQWLDAVEQFIEEVDRHRLHSEPL
jgi:hypothetical protein